MFKIFVMTIPYYSTYFSCFTNANPVTLCYTCHKMIISVYDSCFMLVYLHILSCSEIFNLL